MVLENHRIGWVRSEPRGSQKSSSWHRTSPRSQVAPAVWSHGVWCWCPQDPRCTCSLTRGKGSKSHGVWICHVSGSELQAQPVAAAFPCILWMAVPVGALTSPQKLFLSPALSVCSALLAVKVKAGKVRMSGLNQLFNSHWHLGSKMWHFYAPLHSTSKFLFLEEDCPFQNFQKYAKPDLINTNCEVHVEQYWV